LGIVTSDPDAHHSIVVIINPISGTGGRRSVVRQRVALATSIIGTRGLDGEVVVTERPGHARELARQAVARGVGLCVAWGGDGTVNEVGSALMYRDAVLGVVPSGSGNGLARELCIPSNARAAFDIALDGYDRTIDGGEMDGRPFFNLAGLGLDACVAHEFAAGGLMRRGFRRYLEITVRELFRFEPDDHAIVADGVTLRQRAMLVVVANGRQ
jgi:diacylglycerol kinase family enzyme